MSAALYRIYPHLAEIAQDALNKASLPAMRPQAVWWDGRRWQVAPHDGIKFFSRAPDAPLAGVYTAQARALDIVEDMLIAVGEITEAPSA